LAALLAGCASVPAPTEPSPPPAAPLQLPGDATDTAPLPPLIQQAKSRWVPVRWAELPGLDADALHEAWNAWVRSCVRPGAALAALCPDVRQLAIGSAEEPRAWMRARLQPYRVEALDGRAEDLLTSYYEPVFEAWRLPREGFRVPLYALPAGLVPGRPWYTREQMDVLPEARAALRGRELLWLADPVDALMLHIQGTGRLRVTEPDGRVRLAFAGTNGQPYQSVGRWLLDRGELRDASRPGIKAWVARNP